MKLLKDKITKLNFIFVPVFDEEKKLLQQHYEFLEYCYLKVREAQDVLEKLGESTLIGFTYIEEQFTKSLEALKESLLAGNEIEIKENIVKAKELFWNYLKWVLENNNALSVYLLRQDIEKSALSYNELLALACLLSLTKSTNKEEISKFEVVFSELYKRVGSEQIDSLFTYVVPTADSSELSKSSQQTLFQLSTLINQIKNVKSFSELILKNYLETARSLKKELLKDFWHKEVVLAVTAVDLELQKQFQSFIKERENVLRMCINLLQQNYYVIDELKDNVALNLEAAKEFIEKLDKVFSKDYETHKQEVLQAAQVFEIIYKANQTEQINVEVKKLAENKQEIKVTTTQENKLKPMIETYKNIGVVEIENQLTDRLEELTTALRKTPNKPNIGLKYSQLALNQNDIAALLSQGNIVENTSQVKSHMLTRKMLALLAELQETATFLSYQQDSVTLNCKYDVRTVVYLLEHVQEFIGEIDLISPTLQNQTNFNSSISLVTVKNRLIQIAQKVHQSISYFYPTTVTSYPTASLAN